MDYLADMSKEEIKAVGRLLHFLGSLGYSPTLYTYSFNDGEFLGIYLLGASEEIEGDQLIKIMRGITFAIGVDVKVSFYTPHDYDMI
jgi:predicted Ser/Thr protein kinase